MTTASLMGMLRSRMQTQPSIGELIDSVRRHVKGDDGGGLPLGEALNASDDIVQFLELLGEGSVSPRVEI